MFSEEQIKEFREKLKADKSQKKDYVTPCGNIVAECDGATIKLKIGGIEQTFELNEWMHNQVADKCHINKVFYDYLRESGHNELLTKNINELIQDKEKRMVRTMGGTARALVSDHYRPIDNFDMFEFFMDNVNDLNQRANMEIEVEKCVVTDTKIYLRAISRRLTDTIYGEINRDAAGNVDKANIRVGDVIFGGIQLSNSEVGSGSFVCEPFIHVVRCANGLISDQSIRRRHIGRKLDEQIIDWSDKTLSLEDELLWNKLQDMMFSTFNPDVFARWVESIQKVANITIEKPIEAVNHLVKSYRQFTKNSNEQILTRFAQYGFTKWGLTQAVTDYAQTVKSFDTRVELEKIGNEILLEKPIEVE